MLQPTPYGVLHGPSIVAHAAHPLGLDVYRQLDQRLWLALKQDLTRYGGRFEVRVAHRQLLTRPAIPV